MDILTLLHLIASFLFIFLIVHFSIKIKNLLKNRDELLDEITRLKNLPIPKKEVLSIEAQQILHDMTVNGQSIVRIIPLSPNDIFWRSPR